MAASAPWPRQQIKRHKTRDMHNRFFLYFVSILLQFLKKNSDSVRNKFGSVWSETMQFSPDIIVIY